MNKVYTRKNGLAILVSECDFERFSKMTWHLTCKGYAATNVKINGVFRVKFMHRLIIQPDAGFFVDHINGNKLDNRRENLRVLSNADNCAASRLRRVKSTTGVRGVRRDKSRFHVSYRGKYVGSYLTLEDARQAWWKHVLSVDPHLHIPILGQMLEVAA